MARVRVSALKSSASVVCLGLTLSAMPAFANPTGGQVSSGSATISTPSSSKTVVNQSSQGVVINWKSFDINKNEVTQFVQPNAKSVAINRIGGQNASQILGTLSANGKVVLINPNGIAFGKGSRVNVGALIATTTDGSDTDLLAGRFTKAGSATGYVTNAGRISANGTVALVAPSVSNSGVVNAKVGSVSLGGSNKFTVDFAGDGLVSFAAGDASKASVSNTGKITGANVSMTARVAEGLATGVVNTSGIVTATGVNKVGGSITLDAGNGGKISVANAKLVATGLNGGGNVTIGGWDHGSVSIDKKSSVDASAIGKGNGGNVSIISAATTVKGTIDARGGKQSGNGGQIETSGYTVDFNGAHIDAGAKHGTSGQWLLDPVDITVDATGAATIMAALATSDVSLVTELDNVHTTQILYDTIPGYTPVETSGPGDFYLMAPITWNSSHMLQIGANHSVYLYAPITVAGSGTLEILNNNLNNGSGGIIDIAAPVNFLQPASAHLNINGFNFTLETSFASLVTDVNVNPAGYFALASDVSAAGATYTTAPITAVGLNSSGVNNINLGIVEGLGHSISGLTVQTSGSNNAALIGTVYAAGTVENLHLTDVNVSSLGSGSIAAALAAISNQYSFFTNDSSSGTVSSAASAGGLIGENTGTVTLSWSSANVTGVSVGVPSGLPAAGVGGLVAWNNYLITNSYATGDVTGSGDYLMIGGFVGLNLDSISNSYATGSVLATGSFTYGILSEGGFVGQNAYNVDHSYATGSVTAQGMTNSSSVQIGGFSGRAGSTGMILDTVYASGLISAPSFSGIYVGGIAGGNTNVVKNSVWDTDSTGVATAVGVGPAATNTVPVNSSTRYTASAYTPFTFTTAAGTANAWVMIGADATLNGSGGTRPLLASEYSPVINNVHQLQLIEMELNASYYLNSDVDASATGAASDIWGPGGFVTLGSQQANAFFRGSFYGQGYSISGLTINSGLVFVGLFGVTAGSAVSDLTLVDPSITATSYTGTSYVGALSGQNSAAVSNVYVVGGTVTGSTSSLVGGLVGSNAGSLLRTSSSTIVTGGISSEVGGLAGENSFFGGTIDQSFATGTVNGNSGGIGAYYAGGLVGYNGSNSSITDSFAMGNVTGGSITTAGGLVGVSRSPISNSYSTGLVTGAATIGGAIGASSGTVSNVYWDTETSGIAADVTGAMGVTTAQLQASLLTGLDDGKWSQVAGISFPYLSWLVPTGTPQVVSGTAYTASSDLALTLRPGAHVSLTVDGDSNASLVDAPAGANGYYYMLLSPDTISSGGSNIIAYLAGVGNTFLEGATGSLAGLDVYRDWTRWITNDSSTALTSLNYAAAEGSTPIAGASNLQIVSGNYIIYGPLSVASLDIESTGTVIGSDITANSLSGNAVYLSLHGSIGQISGFSGGGTLYVYDTSDLTVRGAIDASYVYLDSQGSIALRQSLTARTVKLIAGGTVKEAAGAVIDAYELGGSAQGGMLLSNANQINTLSDLANTVSGDLRLNSVSALTSWGLIQSAGDLIITAGGNFAIEGNFIAGGAAKLTAAGNINEFYGSTITAVILTGSASGSVNLADQNAIQQLDAFTASGNFVFNSSSALSVGMIDAGSHNITLGSAGHMVLRQLLSGSIVTLNSGGTLTETATGSIEANMFAGSSVGGAKLNGANEIVNLGSFTNTGAGAFVLNDVGDLDVTGTVDSGTGNLTLSTTGALTLGGALQIGQNAILSGASMALDGTLMASGKATLTSTSAGIAIGGSLTSTKTMTLISAGGISENGVGAVYTSTLSGSAASAAIFDGANSVTYLDNFTANGLTLADNISLWLVDTISAGSGNALLHVTSGDLTVSGAVSGSTVSLISDSGALKEQGSASIAATVLNATAGTGIALSSIHNNIANVGTNTTITGKKNIVQHGA